MIVKSDLESCRKDMQSNIGKRIRLRSNGGRMSTIIQEGVLDSCYPYVLPVRCSMVNKHSELVSFTYIDVLTRVVEIAVEAEAEACKMEAAN
jgi:uncharacterized protein Veg